MAQPTNVIAADFKPGRNFKIGHFCVIEEGCVVGDNVTLENYVLLKRGTVIGDNVLIDSYVKSSGENRIGNDVIIRFNATIAREVEVRDRAFIAPNVMTIYSNHRGEKQGGTVIGEGAYIGAGSVLNASVKIGRGAVVGAMSFVNGDCEEMMIYTGVPAKKTRKREEVPGEYYRPWGS